MARRHRWIAALAVLTLASTACSLEAFDPVVGGSDASVDASVTAPDAGDAPDAGGEDAGAPPGAGGPAVEACINGMADAGDGAVACADADCGAYACVPAPPAGWSAPGLVGPAEDGCAAGVAEPVGHDGLTAERVACGGCACGDPTGASCVATFRTYSDPECSTGARVETVDSADGCTALSAMAAAIGNVTTRISATCARTGPAQAAVTDRPEPAYLAELVRCAAPAAGGCGGGDVCAPVPSAGLCVSRPGDEACPPDYPVRRNLHARSDDSRDCGECGCVAEADSCTADFGVFDRPACFIAPETFPVPEPSCQSFAESVVGVALERAMPSGARCETTDVASLGCVAPSDPVTLCCEPGVIPGCPDGAGPRMALIDPEVDGEAPFCIDTTEVTNADYRAFLEAGGPRATRTDCDDDMIRTPDDWPPDPSRDAYPVTGVDFCDAAAYCEWAGKRLCGRVDGTPFRGVDESGERDPSVAEWTNACDGTFEPACPEDDEDDIAPVGSNPCCSSHGVFDLAGNAREWVDNCSSGTFFSRCAVHDERTCTSLDSERRPFSSGRLSFRCCADSIPADAP